MELIRPLVPVGLMHVQELLDQEVTALASERYARKAASVGGRRHGSNPGTVGLAGRRVPIRFQSRTSRRWPIRWGRAELLRVTLEGITDVDTVPFSCFSLLRDAGLIESQLAERLGQMAVYETCWCTCIGRFTTATFPMRCSPT